MVISAVRNFREAKQMRWASVTVSLLFWMNSGMNSVDEQCGCLPMFWTVWTFGQAWNGTIGLR